MAMNPKKILSSNVLYYPNIEFFDETWVKSTLCIWEKIYRIVPRSYTPKDSDEIKEAIDAGLIENISLKPEDLSATADEFEKFWESVPVIPAGVEGWEEVEVKLHPEKVDARILPILQSLSNKIDPDGWLKLSPEVANTYMLFLAETISRRRRLPKLTDNSDMFSIMHYFVNDGNMDEFLYNDENNEATTSMVLTTLLPGGLKHHKMKTVLGFRSKFEAGRQSFRNLVMEFSEQVSKVEDKNYAQDLLYKFEQDLKKTQNGILRDIGQSFDDAKAAALSIGLPTTLTAIGAFAGVGDPFDILRLGQAGFIGAVATLADVVRNRRNGWSSNDSSYYLQLNKVFKNDGGGIKLSIHRYDRIIEEFIND
jgi:hypothetical protein